MQDPFWSHDTFLFEGTFHYSRDKKQHVRGKLHISQEQYDFRDFGHSLEASYLKNHQGTRTYLFMHPYVEQPNVVMSMTVAPKHYADIGHVLGKTIDSRVEGLRHVDIGNAQAWYYPADRMLVVWECFLSDSFLDVPLPKDTNMASLWTGFERWLLNRYPETERIITPFADPIWDTKEYQSFLRTYGYKKGNSGTFTKLLM